LQTPRQNSFGNDFNASVRTNSSFVTRLISDKLTWFLSNQRGEASGCGTSGKSTWLKHHNALTAKPGLINQT
jgi:hypothetical protein